MKTIYELSTLFLTVIVLFSIGTLTYHELEGWSYTDSMYFTSITLTTIGYGDLHPTTNTSKLFTVFFAFGGVAIMLFTFTIIAKHYFTLSKRATKNIIARSIRARKVNKYRRRRAAKNIIHGSKKHGL